LLGHFVVSFAAKKKIMKLLSGIMSGLTGGLQLYSGVKRLFGEKERQREAERIVANARANEQAWYKRNYYNDYFNSSMARAAMKRVEDTLSRNSRQNRAYAAVTGATPELSLARNEQGLDTLSNMVTNIAAQEDSRRASVDTQHLQNQNSLYNQELRNLTYDDSGADSELLGGISLIDRAIEGVNWGNEFNKLKNKKKE
jgi:hypothetical protein